MAAVTKQDSNQTELRFSEETSFKVANGAAVWQLLEPNSYQDFGGQITNLARNPIDSDRQRKKGVTTDLDASGGFSSDLTAGNLQNILQGFFFADLRKKTEFGGAGQITSVSGANQYGAAAGLDAFPVGSLIFASGFSNSANNGLKRVTVSTATLLTVAETLVAEAAPPAVALLQKAGIQATAGDLDVTNAGTLPALTSTTVNFTTLGLIVGEWIFVGGDLAITKFVNATNNGFKRIRSITATRLEFDKSTATMVTEASTTETIQLFFGRVLKNEIGSLIKRRTYQLERLLGAPDDALPAQVQSEYIIGAVANEFTVNVGVADKVTCDLGFIAADHETRTGATGVKAGTRPALTQEDAFNTSSDFSRIKLSTVSSSNAAPVPLFAFCTDMTVNVSNNASPLKAIGTLGSFEVSVGQFTVGGSLTAYFSSVDAIASIRSNADITLDMCIAAKNKAIVLDMPLLTLGDGRANVEQDASITIPLSMEAASGEPIATGLDYTLMLVFFPYTPLAAE